MKGRVHTCCSLEVKPLDEDRREKLLVKILRLGESRNKKADVANAANELQELRRNGYDVDSYFIMFLGFLERYRLKV